MKFVVFLVIFVLSLCGLLGHSPSVVTQVDSATFQKEKQVIKSSPIFQLLDDSFLTPADSLLAAGGNPPTPEAIRSARWALPDLKLLQGLAPQKWLATPKFCHDLMPTGILFLDREHCATTSWDGTVRVWNLGNGNCIHMLRCKEAKPINVIAKSHDGKLLAVGQGPALPRAMLSSSSATEEYEVCIWEWASESQVANTTLSSGGITCLAFSADNKQLLIGLAGKSAKLWTWANNQSIDLTGSNSLSSAAWSKQGQLITAQKDTTSFWQEGLKLASPIRTPMSVLAIAFTADGKLAAVAGEEQEPSTGRSLIRVYDVSKRQLIKTISAQTGKIYALRFLKDGQTLVSASGRPDMNIRFWDISSGQPHQLFQPHSAEILGLDFHPDELQFVSIGSDNTIKVIDLARSNLKGTALKGHLGPVWTFSVSPDSNQILSGGTDKTIKFWRFNTEKPVREIPQSQPVLATAWNPNGRQMAYALAAAKSSDTQTVEEHLIHLADANTGQSRLTCRGHTGLITSLLFSRNGDRLYSASTDRHIIEWNTADGTLVRKFKAHGNVVLGLSLNLEGTVLASCGGDNTIKLWDLSAGKELVTLTGHVGPVHAISFTPGGKYLASGGSDGQLILWDTSQPKLARKERIFPGSHGSILALTFSPDSRVLAVGGSDPSIRLIDVASQSEIRKLPGHADWVTSLAFTPDGQSIVSSGMDGTIRHWEVKSDQTLRAGASSVAHSAIKRSQDGKWLAIALQNGSISLIDAKSMNKVHSIIAPSNVTQLLFSPDGQWLYSLTKEQILNGWDTGTGKEMYRARINLENVETWQWMNNDSSHKSNENSLLIITKDSNGTCSLFTLTAGSDYRLMKTAPEFKKQLGNGTTIAASERPFQTVIVSGPSVNFNKNPMTTGNTFTPLSQVKGIIQKLLISKDGAQIFGITSIGTTGTKAYYWESSTKEAKGSWTIEEQIQLIIMREEKKWIIAVTRKGDLLVLDPTTGKELTRKYVGMGVSRLLSSLHSDDYLVTYQNGATAIWNIKVEK